MSKGFSILGNRKDISNPMTGVMKVSADLAAIVGKNKATFCECYRILRAYIKENNLRDPENKLFFTPDKKMAKVFGSDRIPVNSMTKVLNKNLSNIPSLHSVPQETHMSSPVEPYSVVKLDNLPDEIILEIFSNIQIPDLISCGEVSKRIRRIADDETLWQKVNLSNKMVPKRFLEGLLATNCKYLSLNHVLIGDPKFEAEKLNLKGNSQLKYLDLSWCKSTVEDIEVILASCHNLEKLSLARLVLTPNMISSICTQNSETLTLLNLSYCCTSLDLEAVSQILSECVNLKEINFGQSTLTAETEDYIAQNLPEWIEKLDLSSLNFSDNQISTLIKRCSTLKALNLCQMTSSDSSISDNTVTEIILHLMPCLEELDLSIDNISCTKILELRAMSNLKILVCRHLENEKNDIDIVKNQFPNLMINTQDVNVAASQPLNPSLDSTSYSGLVDTTEGFFEIRCKRLNMFEDFVMEN